MTLKQMTLCTGPGARWTLSLLEAPRKLASATAIRGREIAAEVPGCVHTDLMAAGLLEDPYLAANELNARWIGECSWRYTAHFETSGELRWHGQPAAEATEVMELVFDGIDTLATVRLNGAELGLVDNMHATWRFDVRETLRRGGNILEIDFAAPLPFCRDEASRYQREIGDFPAGGTGANPQVPHNMLRKMSCNFGWDWGPQLVTCGIWRPLRLEVWETARIKVVRPHVTSVSDRRAEIDVTVDVEHTSEKPVTLYLEVFDPLGEVAARAEGIPAGQRTTLLLEQPEIWWPAGHGYQPLYNLVVSLLDSEGHLLDRAHRRIGLRTFEWVTTPDDSPAAVAGAPQPRGSTFHLCVNGRRVFCKGANWIPDDCFPHRVTPDRYRRRVQQAREANMNMLRVWGGGVYESDAFYDACDELGIMVWQDFATGCSAYPEDDAFRRRFEHEARDNVSRLAGRASLALWCGGNECVQAVHDWGNEYRRLREVSYGWGRHYWYELFPRIVRELDSQTFYWPNSPWSATKAGGTEFSPNLEHIGDQHLWDVWNGQGDWRNYWLHAPRFASEFGFHGPPAWPTLAAAIPEGQRHWQSAEMVLRNKQEGGQARTIDRAREHFRLPARPESPASFDAMWFVAALNQARAIEAGCQWFRALSPWCSGALYWQLNDCWPVSSWSAIDNDSHGTGRAKLLWYATRRFFAPRLCALLPAALPGTTAPAGTRGGAGSDPSALPLAYLHNDHPESWRGMLTLRLCAFDGRTLEEAATPFDIEPGGSLRRVVPGDWAPTADRLITALAEGAPRSCWFFGRDKDLPYPSPEFELSTRLEGSATLVTITARSLLRDLCAFAERVDPSACIDDQLLTLLPGETANLRVESARHVSPSELLSPGVIWSANQFGAA